MIQPLHVAKRELYSLESEMAVIGAAMLSGAAFDETKAMLGVEDFWRPAHRIIWRTMQEINQIGLNGSQGIDIIVLENELKSSGELVDIGGAEYLVELLDACPSASTAPFYAKVVAEHAALRRIQAKAREIAQAIDEGEDSETVLALATSIQDARKYSDADLLPWCQIEVTGQEKGVTTGHKALDELTGVGFVKGQLTIISAYQKGGKTAALVDFMSQAADSGAKVVYATFADLDPSRLKRRALKNMCGFGGPPSGMDGLIQYDRAIERMNDPKGPFANVHVYDARKHGKDVETFAGKIASYARKHGLDAVYCDYAQKITARSVSRAERTAQLEFVSEQLDELAQRTGIAVIAGSQVSKRDGVGWVTQYSVSLEQDAGMVLRISKDKDREYLRLIEVPFNRFGKEATLYGDWDDETVRIVRIRSEA